MRITCPNCAASYDVPDRLLQGAAVRPVRCARCGTTWQPDPAGAQVIPRQAAPAPSPPRPRPEAPVGPSPHGRAPLPEVAPPPDRPDAPPALRTPPPRPPQLIDPPLPAATPDAPDVGRMVLWVAWVVSIGLVAGAVAALFIYRAELVAAWPPAARLFAMFGG